MFRCGMAGRLAFVAVAILAGGSSATAQSDDASVRNVTSALTIQNTLYQARQLLSKGETRQAVTLLESNLHQINGNKDYLATLRDAYWTYVKELQKSKNTDDLNQVLQRLKILEPSAETKNQALPTSTSPENRHPAASAPASDDPFQQTPLYSSNAGELIKKAMRAFTNREFAEAGALFDQAYALDSNSLGEHRASWAYCRLSRIVEQLNGNPSDDATLLAALEREADAAILLAKDQVQLTSFAEQVRERVRDRRRSGSIRAAAPEKSDEAQGWQLSESSNFRVLHRHTKEFADRVLSIAERTRTAQFDKWFGPAPDSWSPRCDIFVYSSADDYAQATRQNRQSPGHSTVEIAAGKVVRRRLDVVGDHVNLLSATLPHEVTHVVLADLFPDPPLPRWADEAMAILAEPPAQVERYLRALSRCKQEGTLFDAKQLLPMNDFPEPKRITAYYCQSVTLVDMLVRQKDARTFAMFLRTAQRYGYEKALERTYGIRGYTELQRKLAARMN